MPATASKTLALALLISLPALAESPPPAPDEPARPVGGAASPTLLTGDSKDLFAFATPDGAYRLRIGGLVQGDARWFPANAAPGPVDQFTLRSARIELDASLSRFIDGRVNVDGGQGRFTVQEAWTELHFHRALRLRVGKMKVPFGLERLQYEGRTAFMERAFPTQLAPNRDTGVELFGDAGGRVVVEYALGVFNGAADNSTVDGEVDAGKEIAGRVLVRPIPTLAVGGAASWASLGGTVAGPLLPSLATDGLTTFFRFADGAVASGTRWRATGHATWYWRRVGVLGEYVRHSLDVVSAVAARATVVSDAWQAYATVLLTDDAASFTGVRPRRPFAPAAGGGAGAWELALRASGIAVGDAAFATGLADPAKSARAAQSYALGVSWYLDATAKLQVDYVRTQFTGGAPSDGARAPENALMARLQFAM